MSSAASPQPNGMCYYLLLLLLSTRVTTKQELLDVFALMVQARLRLFANECDP
jgi:hypothetical protein